MSYPCTTDLDHQFTLTIKYNYSIGLIQLTMKSTAIANQIISNIIREGKNIMHDKYVSREKVPPFANTKAESVNQQMIAHSGFRAQTVKKNNFFGMTKDAIPDSIHKDEFANKTLKVIHQTRPKVASPEASSPKKKKYYHSQNKKAGIRTAGFNTMLETQLSKQKQNSCVKLVEQKKERTRLQRVREREERMEDSIRQTKRQSLLREYQEKKLQQNFKKDRDQKKSKLQVFLQEHMSKGDDHKFTFDISGDLLLFKQETEKTIKQNYPPQAKYKIQKDEPQYEEEQKTDRSNTRPASRLNLKMKNAEEVSSTHENQRIKSARGQAFASAVMKTVNLSRISMNGTLRDMDAEQFMKRNDLFNNNHSRQTTSIPYFTPKSGTVYTELATNQVLSNEPTETGKQSPKPESTECAKSQSIYRRKTRFQGFNKAGLKTEAKSMRVFGAKDEDNYFEDQMASARPVKTAQVQSGRGALTERRPQTSARTGRITTINASLMVSLLQ